MYRALISSDWNECLAPCGPFDPIAWCFPGLKDNLEEIFKAYTSNVISLAGAVKQIDSMVPEAIDKGMMDAYLRDSFITYRGVPELISWCLENRILFMINTTGFTGYFQRAFALGLFPSVPVLSANPFISFSPGPDDPSYVLALNEINDKPVNTRLVMDRFHISEDRLSVVGDSGGDGPHFKWAYSLNGAVLVASMAKPSLDAYCRKSGVGICKYFGIHYKSGAIRDEKKEMDIDFTGLIPFFQETLLKDG